MDGEVEQMLDNNATGTVAVDGRNYTPVNRAPDRLMPSQAMLVTRFAPEDLPWWGELSVLAIGKANELSLKDRTDSSRIPENGTPGFAIFGLRGGRSIGEHTTLTLAGENLGDVDYRIHGSGLNGPGRNFIFSFAHSF
jgi:hemoglobin/transferrin/lactoferrin receptor protein